MLQIGFILVTFQILFVLSFLLISLPGFLLLVARQGQISTGSTFKYTANQTKEFAVEGGWRQFSLNQTCSGAQKIENAPERLRLRAVWAIWIAAKIKKWETDVGRDSPQGPDNELSSRNHTPPAPKSYLYPAGCVWFLVTSKQHLYWHQYLSFQWCQLFVA